MATASAKGREWSTVAIRPLITINSGELFSAAIMHSPNHRQLVLIGQKKSHTEARRHGETNLRRLYAHFQTPITDEIAEGSWNPDYP
jgi:hypothetical protein